jgi:predicted O-methyltransferase YrrM
LNIQKKIDDYLAVHHRDLKKLHDDIDELALRWEEVPGYENYHYQLNGHVVPKYMPWVNWRPCYKTALSKEKLFNIKQLLESAPAGLCVEFGVYTGGTTRMMLDMGREVYAFDTFEGIKGAGENDIHQDGDYNGGDVEDYIKGATIIKGMVPDTLDHTHVLDGIAFAHIDMDVYEPTVHALQWTWTHLKEGGVIVLDDYGNITTPGIKRAVDEFQFGRKLFLPNSQMIIFK